jgi:SAM-dependent methyltransferase
MTALLAPSAQTTASTYRALRRLLREEDAWLLRQIGSERPVVWLRPQPLGAAARHGILALRIGHDGLMRGALRSDVNAWPWADGSIPAIVLQHVVEGSRCGDVLLAESARVLAPEGRLYILRFDRLSPWFWRYGRAVVSRSGAPLVARPIDFRRAHGYGLSLEYRHTLGSRGLRAELPLVPKSHRPPDRWPFASALRASRVWVMRKRRQQMLLTRVRDGSRTSSQGYGLALVRREQGGGDS